MIDLHCHSHFSDGTLSPESLLDRAVQAGIHLLALTDHDTVEGLAPLHAAAQHTVIKIINGIEVSVRWKKHDIHILGLNVNPQHPSLQALICHQNESRIERARQIGNCLSEVGVNNAYQKACDIAGHTRVARPHFAQVLVNEGKAQDVQSAFTRFLGRGRPAYVITPWLGVDAAVEGIIQSGGEAVLAHPLKYKLTRSKLHALIKDFKEAGGVGIEVVSGEMMISQIQEMAGICQRFDLLASSGSDFHHDESRIKLGRQLPLPIHCVPVWQNWV